MAEPKSVSCPEATTELALLRTRVAQLEAQLVTYEATLPPALRRDLEAVVAQIGQAIFRIQTTETLRNNEQEWLSLFDALQDFLFVLDYSGTILHVNQVVLQSLGYSIDEIVDQPVWMVHPPDQHAEAIAILGEMLVGQRDVCPLTLVTREGRQIPVETRVTRGHWFGQKALFGISRNVSAHLRIEAALHTLVHSLPTWATLLFDHDLRFLAADGYELMRTNHATGSIEGRTFHEVLPPDLVVALEPIYRAALAGVTPVEVDLAFRDAWYHLSGVPVRGEAGEIVAGLIIAINISEQKRIQAVLSEQAQAMAALRKREQQALALHDSLGKALAHMNLQAQTIRESISTQHLDKITTAPPAPFTVADLEPHLGSLMPRKTRLIAIIEQHRQWVAEFYGFQIDLHIGQGVATLSIAPDVEVQLLRMIQEAMANVRTSTSTKHVSLILELVEDQLVVKLSHMGLAFDLADTGEPSRNRKAFEFQNLCEQAEVIGGTLAMIAMPGSGIIVRLEVPLERLSGYLRHRPGILLVGSNPFDLHMLQQSLQTNGFAIVGVVTDGLSALDAAQTLRPDIVLMDTAMPGISSIEAMHLILEKIPEMQVVLLTAVENEQDLLEAIKAGAAGYLLKSMDSDELCNQLLGVLRRELAISHDLALRILQNPATQPSHESLTSEDRASALTQQELKVLTLLAQGHTYRAIAQLLDYSERAIKYQMGKAIKKLGMPSRNAAVAMVRQQMQRGLWPEPH
ncbi:response regulator [Candidatus Chloroploca sp. Khr17]|uniref:response regulator n=1 Tax=Candidatus Chloroploca sp. Khr17 TaxID=2496869 RepID=UPI00101B6D7F|nr:response regulator [Candidatus Chloroploca sp. Khr17]